MRSDPHTHDVSLLPPLETRQAPVQVEAPLSPLPNPKSDPGAPGRNPKSLPPSTPAQRLDDLAQIIRAYNAVTENLQHSHESLQAEVVRLQEKLASTDAQIQRSRRLAAQGEMAAGIAHEVRNPLEAYIQLYAGLIVDDLHQADRQSSSPMPKLSETAATAGKIVAAVRGPQRHRFRCPELRPRRLAPRPQAVHAADIFDRAIESHRPAIAAAAVTIDRADHRRVDEHESLLIHADPELLHQAILNMVRNAVEAMTPTESQIPNP